MDESHLKAYLAGIFDGEGSVRIARCSGPATGSHRPWTHILRAQVTMREKEIMELFQKFYSGRVFEIAPRNEKHSVVWRWECDADLACAFLQDMLQYGLVSRRSRALLGVEFQKTKQKIRGTHGRGKSISDRDYQFYVSCFDKMKKMNEPGRRAP